MYAHEEDVPPGWADTQERLASATGLAILLVAGHQPPQLTLTNNNSICQAFQSSPAHAHLCDPYCGEAFNRAHEAGDVTQYRCHAGLYCFAMPVNLKERRPAAVIGGRAFLDTADYRVLAERFRAGDLRDLSSPGLFQNIIFASQQDLDNLAARVAEALEALASRQVDTPTGSTPSAESEEQAEKQGGENTGDRLPIIRFSPGATYTEACRAAVQSLARAQQLNSIALLRRSGESFVVIYATGKFQKNSSRVKVNVSNAKLIRAGKGKASLSIPRKSAVTGESRETDELFPLIVGDELKGALLVNHAAMDEAKRHTILEFCREIAMPLEVLRLREELDQRMRLAYHLHSFTEDINRVEPDKAYTTILRHSAELLRAERSSLLLFDETANELAVKAAVGPRAEIACAARVRLGDGVAGAVLNEGRPLIVRDLEAAGRRPAPAERHYKTKSFISYPIIIGGRRVGVLNVTDKAGGGSYNEADLKLLEMIAPQMALALDRAEWHQKATQFQLLSITDSLTGLLNRRYLEERLAEELERSKRHRFAMSFLMIDIDDFKHYNDRNGHQAGDLALEMTAQCLKSALRSADVASRYGGEEFSILLPQTNIAEAQVIAERIRRRVRRTQFPHGKAQPHEAVTVSIGISAFGPHLETPASIIGAADNALYVAKHRGKDRVELHAPEDPDAPSPSHHAERNSTE